MTEEQLVSQRRLIEQKIAEVLASMPYLDEETRAIAPSSSLGRLTRMEALNDKGVNEHVKGQAKLRLQKLTNALQRIEAGTYGTCIRCGKEIPMGRLELVPEALVCVPCAEKKR